MTDHIVLSRRSFNSGLLLTAAGLGAAACGGGSSPSSSGPATALNVGAIAPPTSLDPAKGGGEDAVWNDLAYDPLIYRAPDGSLQPRLAASWRYLGTGNTTFELTLRRGALFSDGTPADAPAVKKSIEYYKAAGGQGSALIAAVSGVEAVDELIVRLSMSEPHPLLPTVLTQDYMVGRIIAPAGVASPDRLASQTFGAGQYSLVPGETAANDHYTYVPNAKYFSGKDVRYRKVTVKVLPNENTALAALKTGQVELINGTHGIANAAKSSGLSQVNYPNIVVGLTLLDRGGRLARPLGDVRVRQALNYAVDRQKVTKALYGEYGTVTDQPAAPGGDGWNDTPYYRHDPAKARQLLADAGYANGFTLPVMTPSIASMANLVQAVDSELQQIGVRLKITTVGFNNYFAELPKYPAAYLGWGILPIYFMGRTLWLPKVGANPFQTADATLESLDRQAAAADEQTRADLDRQIVRRVTELAWFLPVCLTPIFYFYRSTLAVDAKHGEILPSATSWRPAG